ncbi:hypothetical protein ABW20_dc0100440 [Dactylellina cionopaga]|nr:hypothetical protein ABW20_dc0100440 [Dactylellina cionopaga]
MKVNALTVAALSSLMYSAAGYSIARADSLSDAVLKEAPAMVFVGPAVPGGPNVTITGTAEYIYGKLHEMNPKYDAWEFPEYQERMAQEGISRDSPLEARSNQLTKRGRTQCSVSGDEVPNYITQCAEGVSYLSKLNGWCKAPRGHAGCARVSCSHNCGIFLCNDNDHEISVWCTNLAGDFHDLARECGRDWPRHNWISSLKELLRVFKLRRL